MSLTYTFPKRGMLAASLLAATLAQAEEKPDLTSILTELRQMKAEIAAERAENAALREKLSALEEKVTHVETTAAAPAVPAAPVAAAPSASASEAVPDVKDRYPQIEFHVLGDVSYSISDEKGAPHTFALGDIDPLITAKLTDHSSALGDFVIASNHGDFAFEVERLQLQYKVSDYLNIQAGRFHTMIGYYNAVYHNGTYFQTTVDRPAVYDFEDNGGILPIHSNGISIDGEIPSGSLRLHYVAELANGRDYTPGAGAFGVEDNDHHKAVNVAFYARPEAVPGLQVGGSAYFDTLAPSEAFANVNQSIFSAYASLKNRNWEWLNEFLLVRDTTESRTFNTTNFYTLVSRKFGRFRPYVRLEWRQTSLADPVIASLEQNDTFQTQTLGLRYDFSPMMALKAEVEHNHYEHSDATTGETLQLSFRY